MINPPTTRCGRYGITPAAQFSRESWWPNLLGIELVLRHAAKHGYRDRIFVARRRFVELQPHPRWLAARGQRPSITQIFRAVGREHSHNQVADKKWIGISTAAGKAHPEHSLARFPRSHHAGRGSSSLRQVCAAACAETEPYYRAEVDRCPVSRAKSPGRSRPVPASSCY